MPGPLDGWHGLAIYHYQPWHRKCVDNHLWCWYITNIMTVACRTLQEAVDLLRRCLEDGEVKHGRHFREELAEERLSYVELVFLITVFSIEARWKNEKG
jgi:hypothetical protein